MCQNRQQFPDPNYPGTQTNQLQTVPPGNPIVVSVPAEYANAMSAMAARTEYTAVENERLRYQLNQKRLSDQADTEANVNGRYTYTYGRSGAPKLLMDTYVEGSYLYHPRSQVCGDSFYLIKLAGHEFLRISESDYESDKRLINIFRQQGVRVPSGKTQKRTADLLRQEINKMLKEIDLLFYGGWIKNRDENNYYYFVFSNFSTCNLRGEVTEPSKLSTDSPAFIATAINQFWPVFEIISNPFLREMVLLLYHEAALHTLLEQLGCPFSLSFCIFSTEQDILSYFRALLEWFGDQPFTLDMLNKDFSGGLFSRKDQPLLIEDHGQLDHAIKNAKILEIAMFNSRAEWKKGSDTQSLPLQAPITLLSSSISELNCSTQALTLDIFSEDFDRKCWIDLFEQVGNNQDYLKAFCGYTAIHIHELQKALEEGLWTARYLDGGKLGEEYLRAYGLFIGLRNFLESFYECASPAFSPFVTLDENLFNDILELLIQTSEKADRTSLAEQFVEIARRFITTKTLHTYPKDRCSKYKYNAVFYDDERLYFTSDAFATVCKSMTQSRPAILKALSEAGMICGVPINATTAKTRITVHTGQGKSLIASVYSLRRDKFDLFGELIILEEENDLA